MFGIILNMDAETAFRGMYGASVITSPFYSREEKRYQTTQVYKGYESGQKQYNYYERDWNRALTSPLAITVYTLPVSYGVGAGFGALSKIAPTTAKVGGAILGGYAAYSVGEGAYRTYQSGGSLVNYSAMVGSQFAIGLPGFKAGYRQIGGRVEQFLYARKTFTKGSVEAQRFKSAIETSRYLHKIKPVKRDPLDFRSIERLTPKGERAVKSFMEQNTQSVIGGSASAKTQVIGARTPRDIDLLIQSRGGFKGVVKALPEALRTRRSPFSIANERMTLQAKQYFEGMLKTPEGQHAIDIHGREFYEPGRVLQFGFKSKQPTTISNVRYMRAGEQLFRKGVAGTTLETQYRWFKDIPDFVDIARSQVISGRQSYNPLSRIRAYMGERSLRVFEQSVPKEMLGSTSKAASMKNFIELPASKGYSSVYSYPTMKTPVLYTGQGYSKQYSKSGGYHQRYGGYPASPSFISSYSPFSQTIPQFPSSKINKAGGYSGSKLTYTPPSVFLSPYKSFYKPSRSISRSIPPSYIPPIYPGRLKQVMFFDESDRKDAQEKYKFREFKIPSLLEI